MTQLKYLAITTLLLIGGCTTDDGLSTDGNGSQLSDDLRAGEPDETGAPGTQSIAQGEPCTPRTSSDTDPNSGCDRGLSCVSYYGIAGPRGPLFASCEIKCADTSDCPGGQTCVTIADGPGEVCRPGGR